MKKAFVSILFTIFIYQLHAGGPKKDKHYGIEDPKLFKLIKTADNLFAQHSYYNAVQYYKQVSDELPDNIHVNYKLATCYFRSRDYANAEIYYGKLEEAKQTEYPMAWFRYAETLKANGKYTEARRAFITFYKQKSKDKEVKEYQKLTRKEMAYCSWAQDVVDENDLQGMHVEFLEGDINHAYTDFSPEPLSKDSLLFASLRKDSVVHYGYGWTEQKIFPVKMYVSAFDGEEWGEPVEYKNFNSEIVHTANGVFSLDRKEFYFTHCGQDRENNVVCAIYSSKLKNGEWTTPHKLHHHINVPGHTSTQPTIGITKKRVREGRRMVNKKVEVLYFSSDRPKGFGGKDIWYSERNEKGAWSKPQNCGKKVNTPRDEISPYYDIENITLYFSSNHHKSLGGFDIVYIKGYGEKWGGVINDGVPLNSSYDDTYYRPVTPEKEGFLVSNRPGGIALTSETCCDDIYKFYYKEPEFYDFDALVKTKVKVEKLPDTTLAQVDSASVDSIVLQPVISYEDMPLEKVTVGLLSLKDYHDMQKNLITVKPTSKDVEWIDTTEAFGEMQLEVTKEKNQLVVLTKEGFEPVVISTDTLEEYFEEREVVYMTSLEELKRIEAEKNKPQEQVALSMDVKSEDLKEEMVLLLENMYFEFDDHKMKKESKNAINLLVEFLNHHKDIRVEIAGHTDSKGDDEYNLDLSERRAHSVMQEVIKKGIEPSRLTAKGYGEVKPVAPNITEEGDDNPEGRAKNRRTEIKILGKIK